MPTYFRTAILLLLVSVASAGVSIAQTGLSIGTAAPARAVEPIVTEEALPNEIRETDTLPESLRQGRVLSAVYRVSPPTKSGTVQGFALRLMVDPKRRAAHVDAARATA